jgi:hypothetical protein
MEGMMHVVRSANYAAELWFRRSPVLAGAVAGGLFVSILLLRLASGGPTEAYSMLYVLPIALLALTFGLRGGAAGSLIAVTLILIWAEAEEVDLGVLAWTSRLVPMVLLGLLLGHATDRARRAEAEHRKAAAGALLHQQAIEVNDSLVQGLAAARWKLDQGNVEDSRALLDQTMSDAQGMVSALIRRADMAGQARSRELPEDSDSTPAGA